MAKNDARTAHEMLTPGKITIFPGLCSYDDESRMRECSYYFGAWRLLTSSPQWLVAASDRTLLEKVGDAFGPDHHPPQKDGLPVNIAVQERAARLSCQPRRI
jgi:hypothetical protein